MMIHRPTINLREIALDSLEAGFSRRHIMRRIRRTRSGLVDWNGHRLTLAVAQRLADWMRAER